MPICFKYFRNKLNKFGLVASFPLCFFWTLCTVRYKYWLLKLILTISYMRQYEFKTINPGQANRSPVNIPKNAIPFAQSPKMNFQQASNQSFSFMPAPMIKNIPKVEESIKTNLSNISSGGNQPDQNLSLMRKQLDILMKQTQYVETKKQPSYSYANQESSLSGVRSLENLPPYEKTDLAQKDQRLQNYQKYQNQFRQTQTTIPKSNNSKVSLNSSVDEKMRGGSVRNPASDPPKLQMMNNLQNLYPPSENRKSFPNKTEFNKIEVFGKVDIDPGFSKQFQSKPSSSISSKPWEGGQIFGSKTPTSRVDNPQKFSSESSLSLGYGSTKPLPDYLDDKTNQQNKRSFAFNYEQIKKTYDFPKQKEKEKEYKTLQPSYVTDFTSHSYSSNNDKKLDIESIKFDNKYLKSENESQSKRLAQAEEKIRRLESQANSLKQTQKSALGKEDYYKSLLQFERQNSKQIKQEHSLKRKQSEEQFKAQLQAQRDLMTAKINQLAQKHQEELGKIHEKYQTQIKELQGELDKKQQNIVSLVKEIKVYDEGNGAAAGAQQIQQQSGEHQGLVYEVKQKAFEIENLRKELDSRNEHIQVLNKSLLEFKQEIKDLRKFKTSIETDQYAGFDQILLTQMRTISDYKQKIQSLNEKTNDLRLNLIEAQRKNENYENEIKIIELKHRSEINSLSTQAEIEMTNRDNTIGTLNKKMQTMEQRLKSVMSEIKLKDGFVKQHLVGRADTADARQYIENVLTKYESTFSQTREEQLKQELEKAKKQLELYEKYA